MKNRYFVIALLMLTALLLSACMDDGYMYDEQDDYSNHEREEDTTDESDEIITGTYRMFNQDYMDFDKFIDEKYEEMNTAGMAIAIIEDDEMTAFWGKGYMNMEKNIPVSTETIFLMASITKTITGTAVMQLVEDGLIDLDADVNNYLPYEVINPMYPNKAITVRMLLCHTSSIIDNWDVLDKTYSYGTDPEISLQEFCERYFDESGKWYDDYNNYMDEEPGTYYDYTNAGYALLGNIVENITGKEFYQYCDDNIFSPLGMDNTSLMLEDLDEKMIAVPYQNGEALDHYTFATYPDGGLRTSCVDFSKFVSVMINSGTYNGVEILKADTVDKVFEEQYVGVAENQGLTWDLAINEIYSAYSDSTIIGHNGGESGAETLMFFNPVSKKGAIFLINDELNRKQTSVYDEIVEQLVIIVE